MKSENLKLVVLISCMYECDRKIISRTNVQTDAVVINQCDKNSVEQITFLNKKGEKKHVYWVNTTERGLSKSRNMAISYAKGDVALICDDDECLVDEYENIILSSHKKNAASLITFSLIRQDIKKKYPNKEGRITFRQIFSTNSLQITFKLADLRKCHIQFDEKMGSGTGNGGGEENKFLIDFRKKGLKLYYYPLTISTVLPNEQGSKWFHGYDLKHFENQGWAARRIFNSYIGLLYIVYILFSKRNLYKDKYSTLSVFYSMMKGWKDKR